MTPAKPMKPSQYAEHVLITAILKGTFKAGQALPGERTLATELGVTRPTLRETLQRMAGEGWLKIVHGKTTVVRDYIKEGGSACWPRSCGITKIFRLILWNTSSISVVF